MADVIVDGGEPRRQDHYVAPIASVMVHVDFDSGSDDRIRCAAELAERFGSTLIGVAGWVPGREPLGEPERTHERDEDRLARISVELGRLAERFRDVAGRTRQPVEWRAGFKFPREVIVNEARAADLLVIGTHPDQDDVVHAFDPGAVILAAGRPVMVLPRGVRSLPALRILIAWKDTREARRAVRDALPLLKGAQDVSIAVAKPQRGEGVDEQIADVAKYLARHGVAVRQQIATFAEEEAGQILLQLAKERHADLVVAGAHGRTRLSEWIFGGVTRHFLTISSVPCLFSN